MRRAIAVDSAHVVSIYFNAWLQTPKGFVTRACCKECTCNCLRSASSWSSRVHGLPSYPTLLYLVCPLGVGEHKPPMQELVTAASTRGVICRASATILHSLEWLDIGTRPCLVGKCGTTLGSMASEPQGKGRMHSWHLPVPCPSRIYPRASYKVHTKQLGYRECDMNSVSYPASSR